MHSYYTAIKSGTTTVNDMYRFVGSLADAASKIGIRAVLSNDVALPEFQLDVIEDNEISYVENNGRDSGRIRVCMGHEWLCTSNLEVMAQVGQMKKGKKADVIVVDLTKNHMFTPLLKDPKHRKSMLESHLVFGCNGSAVQHPIIDGKLVMRDYQVLAVDEQELRREVDSMFEAISEEMKSLVVGSSA
jgi:cytosine/adenosine deaminase-related metal-dependent hydrolase